MKPRALARGVFIHLAYQYMELGRYQEACATLEKGLRRCPSGKSLFYRRLGTVYRVAGDAQKATVFFKKALEADPHNTAASLSKYAN